MTSNKTRRLSWVFGLGLATCFAFCTPGMQLLSQGAAKSGDEVPAGSARQMMQEQETGCEKGTQEFRTELEKLKETDPAEYMRAMTRYTLMAQMILGELGYGTLFTGVIDERTRKTLRAYQEHNRLTVSGDVDEETRNSLTGDKEVLTRPAKVVLPQSIIITGLWDQGSFSASGSWLWEGDLGLSTSQIECQRDRAECTEARASWLNLSGLQFLDVTLHTYEIERWDADVIVTVPKYAGCRKEHLYIQRHDERVLQFEIPDTGGHEECKKRDPSDEAFVITTSLVDGGKIYEPRNHSRKAALRRILRMTEESKRASGLFER